LIPKYMVKVEGETQFINSDDELAEAIKKHEKKVGKEVDLSDLEKDKKQSVITRHMDLVEFFEADDLIDVIKKLDKLGVDVEDYSIPSTLDDLPGKAAKKEAKKVTKYKLEKKDETPVYFEGLSEMLKFVQAEGKKGMVIQRYKGLGEMNPEQLWETTMDPSKRTVLKVTLEDVVEADKMFTTLMGDEVEPRREFIHKYAREVRNLDI
jgi:DNA gyrase subunit B